VEGNTLLTSLNGLNNLTLMDGDMIISNNPALQTLTGLEGLTQLHSTLWIDDNPMLLNLNGLENITHIDGLLRISANQALGNLDGLSSLQQIGGSLVIGGQGHLGGIGNPSLVSLNGLSQLTSIGGTLQIEYNESLTSLSGLDHILPGTILGLSVYHNDLLSECEVASVCAYLANPGGSIYISNNLTGCNSVEEVTAACLLIHTDNVDAAGWVKLFPNPVSDRLTLDLRYHPAGTILTIRSLYGIVLYRSDVKNKIHTLDMCSFPAGMYLVQLTTADGTWSGRIIKN
jgi:hypothetical protein